jgi:hypothetical protein
MRTRLIVLWVLCIIAVAFLSGWDLGSQHVATNICQSFGYVHGGLFDGETLQCDTRVQVR